MKIGLNRNQLKYIAIIAMVIDHIGAFFIPSSTIIYSICRFIGKLTAPLMCYFLVEGYNYTSSKSKYLVRLGIFAIISQFAFSLAMSNKIFIFKFNMIFTLFICFLLLLSYEKIKNKLVKWIVILSLILISDFSDWGIFAPLWVLIFYLFKDKKSSQIGWYYIGTCFVMIIKYVIMNNSGWDVILRQSGLFLFIPTVFLYNGKKGNNNNFNKWFFYIFYPLHLLVIALIRF